MSLRPSLLRSATKGTPNRLPGLDRQGSGGLIPGVPPRLRTRSVRRWERKQLESSIDRTIDQRDIGLAVSIEVAGECVGCLLRF